MIWIVCLAAQLLFGFESTIFILQDRVDLSLNFAFSVPLGFGISSIIFFGCSAILGFTFLHLILHMVLIGVISYILLIRRWKKRLIKLPKIDKTTLFYAFISLALAFIITPPMYLPKPQSLQISFTGDLPEEISLSSSFYQGSNSGFVNIFKIRHPICYKCKASSRWLTAFHSAMLRLGFSSMRISLVAPSLLMFYSICFIYLKFSTLFTKKWYFALASLFVFLFAGGFGYSHWFEKESRNQSDLDFVFNFGPLQTEWSHPLFHYIFAFRPSQLSLCIVISMLYLLVYSQISVREIVYIGVLLGILPAVQSPVLICSVLFLSIFFLLSLLNKEEKVKIYPGLIAFAAVAALPLLQYIPSERSMNTISYRKFWKSYINSGKSFSFIRCWIDSLGLLPIFTLFLALFFIRGPLLKIYIPSLFIFLVGNYVLFYPYLRQNIIIFYPFWMTTASIVFIIIMIKIVKLTQNQEFQGMLAGIAFLIFLSAIASSILGYVRLRNKNKVMWSKETEEVANWIAANTPKKAVFIDCINDFNPVIMAGKVAYFHSERLVWMYGFKEGQYDNDIKQLIKNPSSDIAPKIKYAIINKINCASRSINNWEDHWTKVFQSGNTTVIQRNLKK